jgi:hypothetical protein
MAEHTCCKACRCAGGCGKHDQLYGQRTESAADTTVKTMHPFRGVKQRYIRLRDDQGPTLQVIHLAAGTGPWLWLWMSRETYPRGVLFAWATFLGVSAVVLAVAWIYLAGAYLFDPGERDRPTYIAVIVLAAVSFVEGVFADVYYRFAHSSAKAFGGPISKPDAAYFSISTATSTGMGDIHPVSGEARLLVTGQMVVSVFLVVLALGTVVQFLAGRNR